MLGDIVGATILTIRVRTETKLSKTFFGGIVIKEAKARVMVNYHQTPEYAGIPDITQLPKGYFWIAGTPLAANLTTGKQYLPVVPLEYIEHHYIGPDGKELPTAKVESFMMKRKPYEGKEPKRLVYKLESIVEVL